MHLVTQRPAAPLDAFVENLWALHDAPAHTRERIVPSGTLELVVNVAEDEIRVYRSNVVARYPGVVVSGAYRRGFEVDTREHVALVGVHFRSGGACPFLGARADALSDSHVALADLWSPRGIAVDWWTPQIGRQCPGEVSHDKKETFVHIGIQGRSR